MSQYDIVKIDPLEVELGGEKRKIRIGFKAWGVIQEKYGGLDGLGKAMKSDQPGTIAFLVHVGLVKKEGEEVSIAKVEEWLDEIGNIGSCMGLAAAIMGQVYNSVPQEAKGKVGKKDPPKAE